MRGVFLDIGRQLTRSVSITVIVLVMKIADDWFGMFSDNRGRRLISSMANLVSSDSTLRLLEPADEKPLEIQVT